MKVGASEARKFHGVSVTSAPRDADTDTIGIRALDGIHLCTPGLEPVSQKCAGYSSGEVRFAMAIVDATLHLPRPLLP